MLARRLGNVMNSIVSMSQSYFINNRNLVDTRMVFNEIVDFAKKTKCQCLTLKMDFEKEYDSGDWSFLEYMMVRSGFGTKWVAWMKVYMCIWW